MNQPISNNKCTFCFIGQIIPFKHYCEKCLNDTKYFVSPKPIHRTYSHYVKRHTMAPSRPHPNAVYSVVVYDFDIWVNNVQKFVSFRRDNPQNNNYVLALIC